MPLTNPDKGDLVKIADVLLSSNVTSIDLTGIPSNFRYLLLKAELLSKADNIGTSSLYVRLNNASGTEYSWQYSLFKSGMLVTPVGATVQSELIPDSVFYNIFIIGSFHLEINQIDAGYKMARSSLLNETGVNSECSSVWTNNMDFISSIQLVTTTDEYTVGSRIMLYGVR